MRKLAVLASLMLVASAGAQYKSSPPPPPPPAPQPVVMTQAPEPSLESAKRIERDAAIKLVDEKKAVFVDVRPKDAYDTSHIKGAMNIPLSDLLARMKELPTNKEIITYCA
jgi:3-mercaptopyruvate sulfurtransferase SseA